MFGTGSKLKAEVEAQAQALKEAQQAVLARDAQVAALNEQFKKSIEANNAQTEKVEALTAERDELAGKLASAIAERDDLAAKLAAAEAKLSKLAAKPSAFADVVDGEPAPVAEGVVDGVAETWEEALKAEGSYAAAREKHPAAFAARFPNVKI